MRQTILVMDKDPLVLKTTLLILKKVGYDALTADNARQALELCQNADQPIHLLLTDVNMPEDNSDELANCIREKHPQTRVLFMSGFNIHTEARETLLKNIQPAKWGILRKPFNRTDLAGAVEGALSASF